MKHLSFLRRHVSMVVATCLSLSLFSCNNEDEFAPSKEGTVPPVEVSKMSEWLPKTRNIESTVSDMPVLHFKDEKAYDDMVEKLSAMNDEEHISYFKELGYDGAYALWNRADEELEQIFEIDDENQFKEQIDRYKDKYRNIFSFNTIDTYDVTPYFTFTDDKLSLVGNVRGAVVIGNTLKTPENNTPIYDVDDEITMAAAPGPIEPGFKGFKGASLSIKNEKYRITMTIGRIVNGNSFAVEFKTKKKQFLWKKSVSASYSAELEMQSTKFHHKNVVACPNGCKVSILNLRIETVGNVFNAHVRNFKCSRGNSTGSQSFNNIQVI